MRLFDASENSQKNKLIFVLIKVIFLWDIYIIYVDFILASYENNIIEMVSFDQVIKSTKLSRQFSFDQNMRVEKTLIQTLAFQLSLTLMQLLFSFDQDMRVKKTLIQTLASQLSLTLMQLLFSFDQDMRVEKTLIQTLASQLSLTLMQLLFSFDQDMRVKKTLIQTLACQLLFVVAYSNFPK